jgi:hypothetical protein
VHISIIIYTYPFIVNAIQTSDVYCSLSQLLNNERRYNKKHECGGKQRHASIQNSSKYFHCRRDKINFLSSAVWRTINDRSELFCEAFFSNNTNVFNFRISHIAHYCIEKLISTIPAFGLNNMMLCFYILYKHI